MVEPVESLQRGVLDLGEGVIVAVAARADRDVHASLGEALRVADREVCQPQMKRE